MDTMSDNRILLAVDGNSILNRAFYGVKPLTSPDGRPTNAVYGFFNIILKVIDSLSPSAVAVAFDLKAPTFRHEKCDYYKANRHEMPDDLAAQLELLRGAGLPEKPERVEFRTARNDSWSLCYPVDGGMIQIVLRRVDDGSFRFKSAYR